LSSLLATLEVLGCVAGRLGSGLGRRATFLARLVYSDTFKLS
jgi:hypothetical protein